MFANRPMAEDERADLAKVLDDVMVSPCVLRGAADATERPAEMQPMDLEALPRVLRAAADEIERLEVTCVLRRARAERAEAEVKLLRETMQKLVGEIDSLMDDSEGVAGLHKNGDVAPWDDLLADGPYPWLGSLDEARPLCVQDVR